ncbi:PTS sugar transporter subunit IIA [Pasteurellaceae bacterium LIM206]|nr:PTS sugar transporter subunit IIA [Pasteurellaceae bacterium LIM206]
MKFTEILTPDNIRQGIVCSSKKRLLEIIADLAVQQIHQDVDLNSLQAVNELQCFENLCSREKLGCTALSNGVAMPRAKLPIESDKVFAVFLQLGTPLNYDSPDKREVDLVFAVFIPENICPTYAQTLQQLSARFADKNFCKQLRAAQSEQEIWQLFEYADNYLANESDNEPDSQSKQPLT